MTLDHQPRTGFDENAAAIELERLRQDVEESRRRRKDASDRFDAFVRSFRKGPGDAVPAESRPVEAFEAPRYVSALATEPARDRETALDRLPAPAARRSAPPAALVVAAVLAIAATAVAWRAWRSSPAAPDAASARTQPAASDAGGDVSRAVGGGAAVQAELVAVRGVWVRATVDGQRAVEREIEAGTRIPLRGRTFVVRAGDAGALRITVDGQDRGALGPDGIVVTRTYTASPAPER